MPDGRVAALIALAAIAIVGVGLLPPIAQDPAYHAFADRRAALGIPNVANVVSNAGFAVVGALGLGWLRRRGTALAAWERVAALILFAGVSLTAVGSAHYHLAPDNARLVWDRLPITLVFMPLFALVIGDRIDARAGRLLLLPLVAAGGASVVGWHVSELAGRGDLRFYALVQFFPMVAVPLILILFPARSLGAAWLWTALVLYALAKAAELADGWVLAATGIVSGHTLKHIGAALSAACLLAMLAGRQPREAPRLAAAR
ncbi:MAG: alkaline phytoceramidase [Candidatus Rokubacteria bacterium]|nr:alkaline phytoceramidase [Candidatus Rokubacteria bacterium]